QIAKDARHSYYNIDARSPEFFERDYFNFGGAIQRVAHRAHSQQPERLGDSFALCLDVIQPPKDHRDSARIVAILFAVAKKQSFGWMFRASERPWRRDRIRIHGVRVPARWQDSRILNNVGPRTGFDVPAP